MDMISYPPQELTQGVIFSCAASEDYPDTTTRGLVITARCDVAHGKAPVISYIPVIGFRAWLFRDGLRLLASRIIATNRANMKAALRDAGLAESMLETLSSQTVRDYLAKVTEKAELNAANRYRKAAEQKDLAEAALRAAPGANPATNLFEKNQKEYQKLLQDLLSNGISDYHFIERTEPLEKCEGYVALLREIRYIPLALASELKGGIDFQRFTELCCDQPSYKDKLSLYDNEQYAMPIGILQSPFIELFMQRFTHLYARIGVTDYSPNLMRSLREIVPFSVGAQS